ncbi:Uncharacterised protein [Mycobacteroides abscessus subsp. abscessus]|nr:Uncharacterised protein [Mycobacteroides abscessus subsp. abscessus]
MVRADVCASRRLIAAQQLTKVKYCASGQFWRCGAVGLVPVLAHSMPIRCQFPMLVGNHGYIPTPACHATPTATTVTAPLRAMCNWDSGPTRSGRPSAIEAALALSDPVWCTMTPRISLKSPCPRLRQPGYSRGLTPSARRMSTIQTGSPVQGPVCGMQGPSSRHRYGVMPAVDAIEHAVRRLKSDAYPHSTRETRWQH